MKKTTVIAALLALTMGANAQWFDFSNNNRRFDIGFQIGVAGINTNYNDFSYGLSTCIYGVYLDFLYSGPEHKFDNHVTQDLYNDTAVLSINIGYQIPVLPWLRIMPLIGHTHTSTGITDASTVNIEVNDDIGTMYHDFDVTSRRHYFNYGCGIIVQPVRWASFYGVYTNHAIYGGISVSLGSLLTEQ